MTGVGQNPGNPLVRAVFAVSQDDARCETVELIRTTLKARHPFIRFHVMHAGPRTSDLATLGSSLDQQAA
jgi:hypothetical protein